MVILEDTVYMFDKEVGKLQCAPSTNFEEWPGLTPSPDVCEAHPLSCYDALSTLTYQTQLVMVGERVPWGRPSARIGLWVSDDGNNWHPLLPMSRHCCAPVIISCARGKKVVWHAIELPP